MASVSITNRVHTSVEVKIEDLQYDYTDYDKFVYDFYNNSVLITSITSNSSWVRFSNDKYLGNNYFSPNTSYTVTVTAYWSGTGYTVGTAAFITESISPPSGAISPSIYPTIKNQLNYDTCVACCLTSMMELFHSKKMGYTSSYENYSVSYFYGCDGRNSEGMGFLDALEHAMSDGSPRWELVESSFHSSSQVTKSEANDLYTNANEFATENAKRQCIDGFENIDFYDCDAVASAIQDNGCFIFTFHIPNNMRSIPSSGIVPQPSGGWSGSNHSMLLIGLTKINNKAHWIGINSWGTSWGNNGICYIPYDWGCAVASPVFDDVDNVTTSWTIDCYAPYDNNIYTTHPNPPVIKSVKISSDKSKATLTLQKPSPTATIFVYARPSLYYIDWYPKGPNGSNDYGVPSLVRDDPSEGTVEISLNSSNSSFEFSAFAMRDWMLSERSEVVQASSGTDVTLWTWTDRNYSDGATKAQTTQFYSVLHGNSDPTNGFSYKVWNDIVRKTEEVVEANGMTWSNKYGLGPEKCKATANEAVSAKKYNEVRFNIGSIKSTKEEGKPSTVVEAGDNIYGYHFQRLTDVLNLIIQGELD